MNCPRCDVPMQGGVFLDDEYDTCASYHHSGSVCTGFGGSPPVITAETMRLNPCWKCPQCGYSEVTNQEPPQA